MAYLRPTSSNQTNAAVPWGCTMVVDSQTRWPVHRVITHRRRGCKCEDNGGDHDIVRDFLFVVAYEYYYQKNSKKYNALVCNDMVLRQAERLGLDLGDLEIWDPYPHCLPARDST